jgi:hypothetical protein
MLGLWGAIVGALIWCGVADEDGECDEEHRMKVRSSLLSRAFG